MKVYTVLAQRWGDDESHHYIVGVFLNKEHAQNCGFAETQYRGNKYDCKIEEHDLEDSDITEQIEYLPELKWARNYKD